ncbi:hypothetical protein M8J75_002525 [Diaphorina citri]|nr:hypothetical protein M8J75_002525 [Diaphorina citri]
MAICPIPACVSTFIGDRELSTGMKILCLLIIIISLLPVLILFLHCDSSYPKLTSGNWIFALIILVLFSLGDMVPSLCHFICNIIWWIVTVLSTVSVVLVILYFANDMDQAKACMAGLIVTIVCIVIEVIMLIYGVLVYWSFYVSNDVSNKSFIIRK